MARNPVGTRPMADMLLDSTVFRDYRNGDSGARSIVEQVVEGAITASISPLTVFDLWAGAQFDRRTEIGYVGMLSFLEEAPLSTEAAKAAGLWLASVEEEERERLTHFALLAATARERGVAICTRNPEPFSKFYSEIVAY